MQKFYVSTSHSSREYRFDREVFQVHGDSSKGFFATHKKLGCSKEADTPYNAIRLLCHDHAQSVIAIEQVVEAA